MSIPLVQNNDKDAINTSIIAIKRNIERINMLLGLVDNDSPDLSGFATKQELQDAVESLQPVDEVTIDNMHSVTSNAVASAIPKYVIKSLSVPFWRDYSYMLYPADIGLTTFKNTLFSINATSWNQVADIQIIDDDYIRIRVWTISGTNNATVTLNSSGDVSLVVFALQFPPN